MGRRRRSLAELKLELDGGAGKPTDETLAPHAARDRSGPPVASAPSGEETGAPDPGASTDLTVRPDAVPGQHRIKVLLVDDQAIIGESIRRMLAAEEDITFEHCLDPTQAIAVANRFQPTTILQDLVMPEVDGLTLVKYLRANPSTRAVPLIVLSTKEEPVVKAEAFGLGANDYLVKLPDRLEILARIRYHSRGYISQLERDEAYTALERSQRQLELRNRFIREVFGRYLSDDVVESILDNPEALKLGGETRTVTIMMADLRGFTALSEGLDPEQIVALLNNYLGTMTEIIYKYQGTIDEFLGDAILAMFGAPLQRSDDAARAVACAVEMQLDMRSVNERNNRAGLPEVEMGIGLNTGDVVVGNIGSHRRTKYGLVGPPVNLASRIETYTTGGQILVSESTLAAAGHIVEVIGRLEVSPKGVRGPITLYEVGGIAGSFGLRYRGGRDELMAVPEPVPGRYVLIEAKHLRDDLFGCSLVALSKREADLEGPCAHLDLYANVKLELLDASGKPVAEDIYAKVIDRREDEGGFRIRFTSTPPPSRSYLDHLRQLAREGRG
jgi:adenylate cyclase